MNRNIIIKVLKISAWVIGVIIGIVIIIPILLYIPAIQDMARKIAVDKVEKSTGMKVSVGYLRLKFPLNLEVKDVEILEASGDTMLTAGTLAVDVKMKPLFRGIIDVEGAELTDASYGMGNRDSVMMLRAKIEKAVISGADIQLSKGKILITKAMADGADVYLRMLPDTTAAKADTTASSPMFIHADDITLSRVNYRMEMLPTIDSLGCYVGIAELKDGTVDMANYRIHAHSLDVDSVTATYLLPPASTAAASSEAADTTASSGKFWTITADRLALSANEAIYAVRGAVPAPGLDMNYLQVNDVKIEVDSFYNRGTSITVPLKTLSATERCGLALIADGIFEMDSSSMRAHNFNIDTRHSSLKLNAEMGMGDLAKNPRLPLMLKVNGLLSPSDAMIAFPLMSKMLAGLNPVTIATDISGTTGLLDIRNLSLDMPHVVSLKSSGKIANVMDFNNISGNINLEGHTGQLTPRFSNLMNLDTAIHIPAMNIKGNVEYNPGRVNGRMAVTTGKGRVALAGKWAANSETYSASLKTEDFPIGAFMPSLGIGDVTAALDVDGKGYDPMSVKTKITADADVTSLAFNNEILSDITLNLALADGSAHGNLRSNNPDADIDADFTASILNDTITYDLDGDIGHLDLQKLHLSPTLNGGSLTLKSAGRYGMKSGFIDADAAISNLAWSLDKIDLTTPQIKLNLLSKDSLLDASLNNGDLALKLFSTSGLMDFVKKLTATSNVVNRQLQARAIDIDSISKALPFIDMILTMGTDNIAASYLKSSSDISFNSLTAGLHNDSLLRFNAELTRLTTGSTKIDTINVDAMQHGRFLAYTVSINNRPGTMDDFAHVNVNGFVASNRLSLFLRQRNIKDDKGFVIGLGAEFQDSAVVVKFVPYNPTIAYKQWTLNRDNFLSYNFATQHIDANLVLENDKSYLKLFTDHAEGADSAAAEDIVLQLAKIKIQDWLSISPFAPPMKGNLSADLKFNWDKSVLTGKGTVGLQDFIYGRERVGSFDLDVNLSNTPGGTVNADIALMVDSVKTITARGAINDSTASSPFLLDFSMIKFPLKVVNPFLPPGMAKLSGMLNGNMTITGEASAPQFNGYLDFDSTAVKVDMLGTTFTFSEDKIPVDSNIVKFNNFTIAGCNENPLSVNGIVDLRHISDIGIDLSLDARNFQVVKSTRPHGADVYGKAFLDIDASVKGDMERLFVNADVSLLAGTNVTYIVPEATSAITNRSNSDMVKFVQFSDTSQVNEADTIANTGMTMILDAELHILEGSVIGVDLSTDGKNRAQIEAQGDLDYTMSGLNGQRLTGRLNINKGYVRYSMPPILSEKLFNFEEGSYVAFNGNLMNPLLNVHAVDQVRANVTQEGQNSRLVYFDVGLSVTGSLENMNVVFNLSTDDDITVENELASMSPEQRANQAMNLLLYNVYSGAGTKATANLSGNALYSFLTSQLNSWAANNIKGVDISFGVDQYDRTYEGNTSTTTSYSYRVSKSLFNDRVKIIVGGNYSTDADADENLSQNLINDISIEYMLNKPGSMYVRIFRHTGYESILEGEVTQTGVGFVFKKKLNSLRNIFGRKPKTDSENEK